MDENASRAVFLGVSVFVAIITITLILNFYRTAKNTASVANRYDVTLSDDARVNKILSKKEITGLELRYLLNYYVGNNEFEITVYQPETDDISDINNIKLDIDIEKYWLDINQQYLDKYIRPNYIYELEINDSNNVIKVIARFKN